MFGSSESRLITLDQLVREFRGGALILDTRPAEQFASSHIRGSIQISLQGHFDSWAAIIIDPNQKLILIGEDANALEKPTTGRSELGLSA